MKTAPSGAADITVGTVTDIGVITGGTINEGASRGEADLIIRYQSMRVERAVRSSNATEDGRKLRCGESWNSDLLLVVPAGGA